MLKLGPVTQQSIPPISAGGSTILTFQWFPPNPDDYTQISDNPWHFCLLSRILSPDDPMYSPEGQGNMTYRNNNVASKNVTVDKVSGLPHPKPGGTIAVGNLLTKDIPRTFFFEFKSLDPVTDGEIWNEAETVVTLDNVSWNKWNAGGRQAMNVQVFNEVQKQLLITGNNARIGNMHYQPKEWSTMHVGFNFLTEEVEDDHYLYHVIQRDASTNQIIGGETYKIERLSRALFFAEATENQSNAPGSNAISTTLNATSIGEPAVYSWYDSEGNHIGSGETITLNSANGDEEYKLEIIAGADGYKDYDTITVESPYGIINMSPNPSSSEVLVEYLVPDNETSYISITPLSEVGNNYVLPEKGGEISIDVSNYTTGIYIVALIVNNEVIDTQNLIVE